MNDTREDAVLLATVPDGIDAPMIMELLENEGIRCWAEDSSSGSFLRSAMGFSPTGRRLFVPADRLEEARGILEAYFDRAPADPNEAESPEPPPTKQSFIALYVAIALAAVVLFLLETNLR